MMAWPWASCTSDRGEGVVANGSKPLGEATGGGLVAGLGLLAAALLGGKALFGGAPQTKPVAGASRAPKLRKSNCNCGR